MFFFIKKLGVQARPKLKTEDGFQYVNKKLSLPDDMNILSENLPHFTLRQYVLKVHAVYFHAKCLKKEVLGR